MGSLFSSGGFNDSKRVIALSGINYHNKVQICNTLRRLWNQVKPHLLSLGLYF